MSNMTPTSYDTVPYESHPFAQTHPDRLAVVATLLGMRPAPVERCRVLELGCAAGGNLIPMAAALPDSRLVGIDLSRVQLAEGLALVAELGLTNIELRHQSIMEFGSGNPPVQTKREGEAPAEPRASHELARQEPRPPIARPRPPIARPHPAKERGQAEGKYDYIICHGVYSWVPPAVQERILQICKEHLAPQGVAYVSYNTYPGWHMRGVIRDMLLYHARHFHEPKVRVKQARNLLDFLGKSVAGENSPYALLLKSELESFRRSADAYLYHEHLEDVNEPIYFHQFAERIEAKGLRYLGEVDFRSMVPANYPREIENVLQMLAQDTIHMEQYMDFLRNRTFRQTLLCHEQVTPNYSLRGEQLKAFHVASAVKYVEQKSEVRGQESGVRSQGSEVRSQGSGVRGQRSGLRGRESGVRSQRSGGRRRRGEAGDRDKQGGDVSESRWDYAVVDGAVGQGGDGASLGVISLLRAVCPGARRRARDGREQRSTGVGWPGARHASAGPGVSDVLCVGVNESGRAVSARAALHDDRQRQAGRQPARPPASRDQEPRDEPAS